MKVTAFEYKFFVNSMFIHSCFIHLFKLESKLFLWYGSEMVEENFLNENVEYKIGRASCRERV